MTCELIARRHCALRACSKIPTHFTTVERRTVNSVLKKAGKIERREFFVNHQPVKTITLFFQSLEDFSTVEQRCGKRQKLRTTHAQINKQQQESSEKPAKYRPRFKLAILEYVIAS